MQSKILIHLVVKGYSKAFKTKTCMRITSEIYIILVDYHI